MKFMILTYEALDDFNARTDPARHAAYWAGWQAFGASLKNAGIVTEMHGLRDAGSASTIRIREGRRQRAPGPFAAGETQLGGYFIIEVEDEDVAADWAAQCPAAIRGAVEIRPVL